MSENQGRARDFVLAPNEFLFIQDRTKGLITVYVGPHKNTLSETDTPIIFEAKSRRFVASELQQAIQQHPSADEGWYITLEQNLLIGVFYTVVSFVRSYGLRRFYNWWHR